MDVSTEISIGSLIVSAGSLVVAVGAFVKSFATDRREREAVVSVDAVWSGRLVEFSFNEAVTKQLPKAADRRYVIAPAPVISENIVLRETTSQDDRDEDKQNYTSYRALLEFRNGGRATAEAPVFYGRIVAQMFDDAHAVAPRTFPFQFALASLPAGVPLILEVRCMISVPTMLHIDSIDCAGRQPVRLTAPAHIAFQPRS